MYILSCGENLVLLVSLSARPETRLYVFRPISSSQDLTKQDTKVGFFISINFITYLGAEYTI
jgi:hypothetical protein